MIPGDPLRDPDASSTAHRAVDGACGFPGCILADLHRGPHEFDPFASEQAAARQRLPSSRLKFAEAQGQGAQVLSRECRKSGGEGKQLTKQKPRPAPAPVVRDRLAAAPAPKRQKQLPADPSAPQGIEREGRSAPPGGWFGSMSAAGGSGSGNGGGGGGGGGGGSGVSSFLGGGMGIGIEDTSGGGGLSGGEDELWRGGGGVADDGYAASPRLKNPKQPKAPPPKLKLAEPPPPSKPESAARPSPKLSPKPSPKPSPRLGPKPGHRPSQKLAPPKPSTLRPEASAPPPPASYRRVHVRLQAYWEQRDYERTFRIDARMGLCGFPGCPLPERHTGPHAYDGDDLASQMFGR